MNIGKTVKVVTGTFALAACLPLMADTWYDPNTGYTWKYVIYDGTAEIYDDEDEWAAISPKPTGALTIPSTLGGKPVTSIGNWAFEDCNGLTSVTIPDSVTNIGSSAFSGCSGLMSITVDSGNAYYSSENGLLLSKDGKTLIQGMNGNVIIPNSVTNIWSSAFSGCSGLMSITVDSGNAYYSSENGLLLSKDGKTLIQGVNGNVIIPDSVTSIGDSAFYDCSSLTSVTIPDSVTNIGSYAFSGCTNLTSVTIPDSVTSIGWGAFIGCIGLTNVTIGTGVKIIEPYAFGACMSLKEVTIPDCVETIGHSAFLACVALEKVTIGAGLRDWYNVGYPIFGRCTNVTEVVLRDGLTNIGGGAFLDFNISSLTVPASVTNIGVMVFNGYGRLSEVTFEGDAPHCDGMDFGSGEVWMLWNVIWGGGSEDICNGRVAHVKRGTSGWDDDGNGLWQQMRLEWYGEMPRVLVSFDANGGEGGWSRSMDYGAAISAPTVTRTGYTFAGWQPALLGTVPASNVTFTAQWKVNGPVVTFNANGGSVTEGERSVEKGKAVGTLPKATRTGYTLKGWYTAKSGGTKIKTSTKVKKNVTYYAQWTANKYTIKFNANGGTGTTMKALSATYGKPVTLTANAFKRTNYTFLGWATTADATEAKYANKAKVKNLSSKNGKTVTLYAVWKQNTYTVKFSANGGEGGTVKQTVGCGTKTALATNGFTRAGFKFAGWATKKDGSVVYKNKAKVKDLAKSGKSLTLYAVWKPAAWAVGTFNGAGQYVVDAWGDYDWYDFVHTATVGTYGKLSGSVTVDVDAGRQEKASFSASSAQMMYEANVHLDFWHDGSSAKGWKAGCSYDGPAYYYDVSITLHGVKKTRRIWICDLVNGVEYNHEEGERLAGVSLTVFGHLDAGKGEVFEGEGAVNLWKSKAYGGSLPKFSSSSLTKKVTTKGKDACTFTFKKDGSATVKITRANGQTDSASFTMEVRPQDGGKWFLVEGNWIFPKGSIAYVEFEMTPSKKGTIAEKNIKVLDIDVDLDD